jgi:TolB protein
MNRFLLPFLLVSLILFAMTAGAQSPSEVRIDISSGGRRIRLHCEALVAAGDRNPRVPSAQADEVLANDLDNSAVFTVSRGWQQGQKPFDVQGVVGGKWEVKGNRVTLSGEVGDFPARRPIFRREYKGSADEWRQLVHRFADDLVQQFTGEPGSAATRIAFVGQQGRNKELYVMDADGFGVHTLTADHSLALSPAWSPEGSLLLFTSYRSGLGAQIYVTPSAGGKIYLISGRSGLNTSASYSPDGKEIVCSLSQDGNSEIYLLDARGQNPRRLTDSRGIDTSPAWSPTGREIAFTSDRSGTPQVYVMDHEGGNVRRLTYDINYTDSPAWSPKGDRIALVSRTGGGFDIWLVNADGSQPRLIVTGGNNENPRWSSDGRQILFSSDRQGPRGLFVSDLSDRPPRRLDTGNLVASSPAWSPRFAP